jgi:hypothetical protein
MLADAGVKDPFMRDKLAMLRVRVATLINLQAADLQGIQAARPAGRGAKRTHGGVFVVALVALDEEGI